MGQALAVASQRNPYQTDSNYVENLFSSKLQQRRQQEENSRFPDLKLLPPELGIKILSNVDARELRVCHQFWEHLADDDLLWKRLCYSSWGYCSAYLTPKSERKPHFWKTLFCKLEQCTDHFNEYITEGSFSGISTLLSHGVLRNKPDEIAEFLLNTELLRTRHVVALLRDRSDVMEQYVFKHDFRDLFLPVALRSFFFKLSTSTKRQSLFIANLLDVFSRHYCHCNSHFNSASILIMVHSMVLLSNDLCNPAIKNKMSKREYIRNTRQAMANLDHPGIDEDFLTHVYDNIYLIGHVAPERLDFDEPSQ